MTSVVGAILAAGVGIVGAYLIAAKQFRGEIDNSAATDLWKESSSIREWSAEQLVNLNRELDKLKERVGVLEHGNEELSRENRTLLRENERLNGQVSALSTELGQCRRRVGELEAQIA